MLRAVQRGFNHSAEAKRQKGVRGTDVRTATLRAIHATWRKICPLDGEELRDARLVFATKALSLKKPLKSTGQLSPAQLGRVLDEMRRHERAPGLPGAGFGVPTLVGTRPPEGGTPNEDTAEVHHLATKAQTDAIGKLIRYLGWSAIGAQAFIAQRYHRDSERMLTPSQANALTMILFNIAGAKAIKARRASEPPAVAGGQTVEQAPAPVTRRMIAMEIPRLKRELGIDQKPFTTEDTEGEFNG